MTEKDDTGDPDDARKADAGRKPRRKKITIAIVVILTVIGVAGGIAWYLHARQFETTDDAFIDGHIIRIAAQERGNLVAVPVEENASVEKGDTLAKIDPATLLAELKLREAKLAEARTSVGQAEANLVEARAETEGAQSTAKGAEVTARNARARADRFSTIAADSGQTAISTQQLDDRLAAADEAEANAAAAQAKVVTARSRETAAAAQVDAAKAGVAAAQASVAAAQVDVERLTVTAPIAGQIVQRDVNIGTYVSPGMQLMALVPEDLYVTANFKETQLSRIRPGQAVDIRIDAFPGIDFKGKIVSIQKGAGQAFQLLPPQNATGNFVKVVQRVPVRISIDSPGIATYPIGPGMSVEPRIRVED